MRGSLMEGQIDTEADGAPVRSPQSPSSSKQQSPTTSGKKPPKYDYYNPSTWLVAPEEEEEQQITDDIFAKLNAQNNKLDAEDQEKTRIAEEEAAELAEAEEQERQGSPVRAKPTSQPGSPMRLPYRKATMKIFHDEEQSDSDGSYNSYGNGDQKDDGGHHHLKHEQDALAEGETDAESRAAARLEAAKKAMIKHRAKFVTGEDEVPGSHEELMEALLNPASIPTPDPPPAVFALGKDGCAAVWWHYDRTTVNPAAWVTEWEVKRYRLDRDDEWRYKGTTIVSEPHLIDKNRCTVEELENNTQYCFSVTAVNRRGRGFESQKSEAVMVEASLPPGWFRFWNEDSSRYFYSNIKTRQADWTRPENDEWYLDEGIVLNFKQEERDHLRELFEEEMFHFRRITIQGFKRIILEVGEVMGKARIREYFMTYAGKEQITSWTDFMYIVSSIKKKGQNRDKGSNCLLLMNYTLFLPYTLWIECLSARCTRCSLMLLLGGEAKHERQKIGDWVAEYSQLAERNFYTNTKTHEVTWDTPEEVRFYLPEKMRDTLLNVFTEGDIADFKVRFGHLDLDNSGFIDEHEFKLLLESMDINVTDRSRRRLIHEIDINGNGTIEFHEFCYMMLSLHKQKQGVSSIWDQIRVLGNDEAKLQAVTDDMVAVEKWEEEHGDHDKAHNPHFMVRHRKTLHLNKNDEIIERLDPYLREREGEGEGEGEVTLVGDEGVGQGEGEAMVGEASRPGTSAGGVYAVTLTGRPGTSISRPGTHLTARTVSDISALDWGSRPGTTTTGQGQGQNRPGTQAYSRPATHYSHRSSSLVPPTADSSSRQGHGHRHAGASPPVREGEPMEREDGVWDIQKGQSLSWDNRSEADSEVDSDTSSGYIIDALMKRKEVEDKAFHARQWKLDPECVRDCVPNSVALFFLTIDLIDATIDAMLCKRPAGEHGRHCMCGCRKVFPEEVMYPIWTKSKDEPLTWGLLCPCCCSDI